MQVQYLGPLMMGLGHPALFGYDLERFPASCFAVELKEGAGLDGPLIEGDVLIADESRMIGNEDLTIAKVEGEHLLARAWRIGGRLRLIPLQGRESVFAREEMLLGVVVSQARSYVA
ncbi:MAG: hypothetical protein CMN25_08455 [Salinicola sp.]|uniref:hypothetical protein n=1 Tax=uncultured Salinicola sp. TaxID=1193542 RepID=UPI000C93DB72|nr:hypothetical protein [uncultured Salinicola sp.]MAM57350.1 hypothetical protein [Salinicola sp.]|tara:strand:- start:255 stop:605 length:351 start_codon:yes stop_codon:yes gene_type:complete